MSDVRIGITFRAVRRRLGLRQADVARRARVSPSLISRIERGQLGSISLARARRVAEVLEIRLDVIATWRGGELERVLNARHASLADVALELFEAATGWETASEVSFSIYGEHGVIDIVAWHEASRTLLIVELKTELVDPQGLIGTMDRRRRLASRIVADRGWRPAHVGYVGHPGRYPDQPAACRAACSAPAWCIPRKRSRDAPLAGNARSAGCRVVVPAISEGHDR